MMVLMREILLTVKTFKEVLGIQSKAEGPLSICDSAFLSAIATLNAETWSKSKQNGSEISYFSNLEVKSEEIKTRIKIIRPLTNISQN